MVDYRRAVLGLFFEQESPVPPLYPSCTPTSLLAFSRENNRNEEEEEGKMGIKKLRKENNKIVEEENKK